MEHWLIIAQGFGTIFIAVGLVTAWVKNGRSQARRDQKLVDNQKNIIDRLDNPNTGLTALKTGITDMQRHCATTSTALTGRVNTLERDIKELKGN